MESIEMVREMAESMQVVLGQRDIVKLARELRRDARELGMKTARGMLRNYLQSLVDYPECMID